MTEKMIMWPGASGTEYKHWILPIGATFKDVPGIYIFAKETSPGKWTPIYIGQTENLHDRLSNHDKMPCVKRYGGTHIHAHTTFGGQSASAAEKSDLLSKWSPPCNEEQRCHELGYWEGRKCRSILKTQNLLLESMMLTL